MKAIERMAFIERLHRLSGVLIWFLLTLVLLISLLPNEAKDIARAVPFLFLFLAVRLGVHTYWKRAVGVKWTLKGHEWSVGWRALLLWVWMELILTATAALHLPSWVNFWIYLTVCTMAFLEATYSGESLANAMATTS